MTGIASYYRFGVLPVPRHEPTIPQPYDGSRLDCSMWNGCTETQWREVWYKRMEPIEDEV